MNYNKLWKLLIDKKLRKKDLREMAGLSTNVIARWAKAAMFQRKCSGRSVRRLIARLRTLLNSTESSFGDSQPGIKLCREGD